MEVEVYTNVDWAGSVMDRRSTSRYCSFVGGNLVTWWSKKRLLEASAEEEFRAVAQGICEVFWIKRLLEELKVIRRLPMKVFCDNKAAIAIAHNPVLHDRTKHVEVDKHFMKENWKKVSFVCLTFQQKNKLLIFSLKGYQRSNLTN